MKASIAFLTIVALLTTSNAVRVNLPFGVGAEGVAHVKANNYVVSDLLNGKILYYDSVSDLLTTIAEAGPGQTFQGIKYDRKNNYVIAAGSGPAFAGVNNDFLNASGNPFNFRYETVLSAMHVIDFYSGEIVASCPAPEGSLLVNDVAVDWKGEFAYFTESLSSYFYRLNLKQLPACKITKVNLPPESFGGNNFFTAGMVNYRNGIIMTNLARGNLWYHDLRSKQTYPIVDSDPMFGGQVGLGIAYGTCLLSADNFGSKINVFRLTQNNRVVSAKYVRSLSGMDISEPSTIATNGNTMVATSFNNTILGAEGNIWLTKRTLPPVSELC